MTRFRYFYSWTSLLLVLAASNRCAAQETPPPKLNGYRPITYDSEIDYKYAVRVGSDGVFEFVVDAFATMRLFGQWFTNDSAVAIVTSEYSCAPNSTATKHYLGAMTLEEACVDNEPCTALVNLNLPKSDAGKHGRMYYFCLMSSDEAYHQGDTIWNRMRIVNPYVNPIPLAVRIIFICVLMVFSGMFSGLNLGLMALDVNALQIIMESGTVKQRGYAKSIYPVRKRGNYLLCTLLLGNVMVNSTFSILLGDLTNGVIAIVGSTLAIVIFGEIIPQAVCSRYGLFVGAKTIYLTYFFMILTFPVSFPLSLILDRILGEELGSIYNRDQLLHLLRITKDRTDLEKDEVNIMTGALEFRNKTVGDVMTKISDVFCLEVNSVLDFKTIKQVYESGFSRVPVYEGDKNNMVGVLFLRDLAFIDPENCMSLLSILNFQKREFYCIYADQKLGQTLEDFASGKSHMAIVTDVITQTEGDPFYKVVGVVTLEDIVEEILQTEICDETDRFVDNRTLKPRNLKQVDIGGLVGSHSGPLLTQHQSMAIIQFLSTAVEPFSEEHLSPGVLKKLLQQDIVRNRTFDEDNPEFLYTLGKPSNMFVLIIEGTVQVEVGSDKLQFPSRSFSHFGVRALMQVVEGGPLEYVPDFSVEVRSDCQLMAISQMQYRAAYRATQFERGSLDSQASLSDGSGGGGGDMFKSEWLQVQSGIFDTVNSSPAKKGLHSKKWRTHGPVSSEESALLLSNMEASVDNTEASPADATQVMFGYQSTEETPHKSSSTKL